MTSRVALANFDARAGFSLGRPRWVFIVWYLVKIAFFLSAFPFPSLLKVGLLRLFGATVGDGVVIKPRVNIHIPWKLRVGNHVWLGEEAFVLNFEEVSIGSNTCISQRAFLCAGNHDFRDPGMCYRNAPIMVGEGAWVGAQVFVGPGVIIGNDAVVCAGAVLVHNAEPGRIYAGNPARPKGWRWKSNVPLVDDPKA